MRLLAGNFYEYEVTNGVYELHTPKILNNPNPGDNENYYGDYTYYGARELPPLRGYTGAPATTSVASRSRRQR